MGRRQALQCIFAPLNPVFHIPEIGSRRTIAVCGLQTGQAEISHIKAGVFLGAGIRRGHTALMPGLIVVRRKAPVSLGEQPGQVILAEPAPIIQVQQTIPFVYLHLVAGVCGMDG